MFRKFLIALPIVAMAAGGSAACATKKFVRTNVGEVNTKVDSLGRSVEETQERTRQNEGKITDVDARAQAAAAQAKGAADQAKGAADQANGVATNALNTAGEVDNKLGSMDKANRRLVYEVVLNEDQGNFKSGKTDLPDEAKQNIDAMVQKLKEDPKNVYIEIEGHTDNVGPKELNDKIGMERAESVKRYLYEQYQVPLFKMNVISYGPDKPVAPNKTKAGRAQNRRVVIRVLA